MALLSLLVSQLLTRYTVAQAVTCGGDLRAGPGQHRAEAHQHRREEQEHVSLVKDRLEEEEEEPPVEPVDPVDPEPEPEPEEPSEPEETEDTKPGWGMETTTINIPVLRG